MRIDLVIHRAKPRWWEVLGLAASASLVLLSQPIGEWLDKRFPL